jgi:quinoprotein glucose dehydrogenase
MTFDERDGLIVTTTTSYPFTIRLIREPERFKPGPFPMHGTPYYAQLLPGTIGDVPICKPPWGTLAAIDPATGAIRWQRPLGYIPQASEASGYMSLGSPTVGGAITTATGITFVAGTKDGHLRAIDSATGKDIAQFALPTISGALPIIYSAGGREYVLVCCGGHGFLDGHTFDDKIVAFSL